MQIEDLFDFQLRAVEAIVDGVAAYYTAGPDRLDGRDVPFVGQLKAVTGAGKTPILASAIGRLASSIVLWTTKFGSVAEQTVNNLRPGGKYHDLLGGKNVQVLELRDIASGDEWLEILEQTEGLTILVSTVAAWNSATNDDRLNVRRPRPDWQGKSPWEALKLDRKRRLWVVYDEAHNSTDDQVEQLDELGPAGFFVAGASPVRGKLQQYLSTLSESSRAKRIVPVKTREVVDAQLLKSTLSLVDYDSSEVETVRDAAVRRESLASKLAESGSPVIPKAIYVVETSNTTAKGAEARPVAVWKMLVNDCGVSPASIAVCTNTRDLPADAIRVSTVSQLSESLTHIIFNKKLQEGWDDPSVYICYFDGATDSGVRIQQVLGRALRQPTVKHFSDEDLNTAYIFFNSPSDLLDKITEELKEELQIYKEGEPDPSFEPFKIRHERQAPSKIQLKDEWKGKLQVLALQPELPAGERLTKLITSRTYDFSTEDRRAPGRALTNVVSVATGQVTQNKRDLLEDMRTTCGQYLHGQIRIASKNCGNAIPPSTFLTPQLQKSACYRSKALEHYKALAVDVVREYEAHVRLSGIVDPEGEFYTVGSYQPSSPIPRNFNNAGHSHYDAKSFNPDESEVAKALDKFDGHVWVRNKDRLDYGIPLPIKSGSSSTFYPDYLWWVRDTVWAIDPTGKFILEEKIRAKLLMVPAPLRIALIARKKLGLNHLPYSEEGWSLIRFRTGNSSPETFDKLSEVLSALEQDS